MTTSRIWRGARFGSLAASAWVFALVLLGSRAALAADVPRHRLDFRGDKAIPLCADPLDFLAIVTNWVPLKVFDPPPERDLVVRVRRAPDGAKLVDVTITDPSGAVLGEVHRRYEPATECFKVLYAAAFETATLLGAFEPPPPAPPPPAPAPCPATPPAEVGPVREKKIEEKRTQEPAGRVVAERSPVRAPGWFIGLGPRAAYGLTSEIVPGLMLAGGRRFLPWLSVEVDVAWMPPWKMRPVPLTTLQLGTFSVGGAGCLHAGVFTGCLLGAGDVVRGRAIDKRYTAPAFMSFFGLGLRLGLELPVHGPFSMRIDVDGSRMFLPSTPYEELFDQSLQCNVVEVCQPSSGRDSRTPMTAWDPVIADQGKANESYCIQEMKLKKPLDKHCQYEASPQPICLDVKGGSPSGPDYTGSTGGTLVTIGVGAGSGDYYISGDETAGGGDLGEGGAGGEAFGNGGAGGQGGN